MRKFIKGALSDTEGYPSSGRIVFMLFGTLFSIIFCVGWAVTSIQNGAMADIPAGVAGVLGTLLVGKALQSGVETYGEIRERPKDSP